MTQNVYEWPIYYKGAEGKEEVDSATSYEEARYLAAEYRLAFKTTGIWIGKKRKVEEEDE